MLTRLSACRALRGERTARLSGHVVAGGGVGACAAAAARLAETAGAARAAVAVGLAQVVEDR
ncbi:MAG: hypothetical protein GXY61_00870, partial [Lentisphaerae bacterium]|nr:hypothetical protein [Lentisphaerota bacterium]